MAWASRLLILYTQLLDSSRRAPSLSHLLVVPQIWCNKPHINTSNLDINCCSYIPFTTQRRTYLPSSSFSSYMSLNFPVVVLFGCEAMLKMYMSVELPRSHRISLASPNVISAKGAGQLDKPRGFVCFTARAYLPVVTSTIDR